MSTTRVYEHEKEDFKKMVKEDIIDCLIKAGISDTLAFALLRTLSEKIDNIPDLITALTALASGFYGFGAALAACMLLGELMRIDNNYSYLYDYNDLKEYREEKKLLLKNKYREIK